MDTSLPQRHLTKAMQFPSCRALLASCASILTFAGSVSALDATAPSKDDADFFTEKIRPILADNCFKCHSHAAEKIKGGLVVDSREAMLTGGDTAPAVVPGDPEKSLLIEAIRYTNTDLQMPPKNKKLSDEQIALLTEWIKRGAPWKDSGSSQKMAVRPKGRITDDDRKWWAFQSIAVREAPAVADNGWCINEIDHYVLSTLKAAGLEPAPAAGKRELIRRVYFDVIGLPPSPEEVDAFVADDSPDAYPKLVDKLLASPRYGEQWARHWLDLVRYADSDGFKIDELRPEAWRYRDYVIRAFNEDKPYDRFVEEQLAGDELFPDDLDARVATGYLRHGIYEYNNRDVAGQWTNMLNEITDVTGDVFLGLGMQCARCHDHKFDPILQKDYFRLQAFFSGLRLRDDLPLATTAQQTAHAEALKAWETKTTELREQIAAIEEPARKKAAEDAIKKFPPETQAILRKSNAERTPWEEQIAQLAFRQVLYEWDHLFNHMRGAEKDKLVALQKQLAAFDKDKPAALPAVQCATDIGTEAAPVLIPKKANLGPIAPGFPTVLEEQPAGIQAMPNSTGRRAALARWLVQPSNPLTARVLVNRVWQWHFGRGIVGTTSDFGTLGDKPSHPELLDWLAHRFIDEGWSLKQLHRRILLSATYRQAASGTLAETTRLKDPENRLLSHANIRRLDAEQIRDAILSTTGELKLESGGPARDAAQPCRSIYTKVLRNTHDAVLESFDAPDSFSSVPQRNVTTTPTQALLMMNGAWPLQRAKALSRRLQAGSSADLSRFVSDAYRLVLERSPSHSESERAMAFIDHEEELVPPAQEERPAPFLSEKMPLRDGRAAALTPGTSMERLTVPHPADFPATEFTVEAFTVVKSLYDTGEVRTIVSQWDGKAAHPGWSFGVTGKQSRYKPQTLVLLLRGDEPWTAKDPVEPVFSGLRVELGKPYFVAVSVRLSETGEQGITFYTKDLTNDDEPLQSATIPHRVTSGIRSTVPLQIGARSATGGNLFDGLIDDVRISNVVLPPERLLLNNAAISANTLGYWKFENDPGVYKDSSSHGADIAVPVLNAPKLDPRAAALMDFCHVLLNTNEFIYLD